MGRSVSAATPHSISGSRSWGRFSISTSKRMPRRVVSLRSQHLNPAPTSGDDYLPGLRVARAVAPFGLRRSIWGRDCRVGFTPPKATDTAYDEYLSDPAKPVPFRARPIQPISGRDGLTWSQWLTDDQREASGRPDVLAFVSDVLTKPLKISGQPVAHLVASTSGTDSDWVIKLIDVYPPEVAAEPELGGYQLMIAANIFRGRYRKDLSRAVALTPNMPLLYRFALPTANHVFLPGHRIMVQIQSSWFPLYDRNPQTFVPNIFWARPSDYQKATQRVYHAPDLESFIELPVVEKPQ